MYKLLLTLILLTTIKSSVWAADNLLIRLEEPQSPTNDKTFSVSFVVLDKLGRDISVACESGTGVSLSTSYENNTGSCLVDADLVKNEGTYTITATAKAGGETASDTVTFEFNNETPDTPRDYSKRDVGDCKFEIKFKTADDGGKTDKVEIYRSSEKSFKADNGSRIAEITVGSNTEKAYMDTVPECNKTYYYAVRAFSSNGNGSGVIGDKEIKIIETDEDTTDAGSAESTSQAIPVARGTILGVSQPTKEATDSGLILGIEESTQSATLAAAPTTSQTESKTGLIIWTITAAATIGLGLWAIYNRFVK